jgi:hypothetical protein
VERQGEQGCAAFISCSLAAALARARPAAEHPPDSPRAAGRLCRSTTLCRCCRAEPRDVVIARGAPARLGAAAAAQSGSGSRVHGVAPVAARGCSKCRDSA